MNQNSLSGFLSVTSPGIFLRINLVLAFAPRQSVGVGGRGVSRSLF